MEILIKMFWSKIFLSTTYQQLYIKEDEID